MFAGAAFTDQADIAVDSDVVDTLVALGVIDGYEDGTFRPDDTVTRAEMAKMIYTVRTGRSDASAYNDDTTSFTDITSHWARGYIKYCQSMGIISGKSVTSFDPDGTVTTQEAAKMLLVTLGYNAERAGLEGSGWGTKTNALADENGLLDDVFNGTTQGLPRQYAAQLIYNAINAPTVVWRDDAYTNTNYQDQPNKTIGQKYMGLYISVGTLNGVVKESGKDTYKMTLDVNADDSDKFEGQPQGTFTNVAKDYSALKNQVVKVLFKDTDEVYGVFATEDTSVLSGVVGDFEIDGGKVKFDGSKYSIADTDKKVNIDENPDSETISQYISTQAAAEKAADAKIVLNSDDKVDTMDVTTYMVGKVSYVGSDYVNVVYKGGFAANNFSGYSKLDSDSCNSDISDLKKDDYVIITNSAVNDKLDAVKADTVTGSVASTRGKINGNDYEVRIDGTWYESALTKNDDIALSNDVTVVLKDGYIVFVDDVKIGSTDVALLIEAAASTGVGAKYEADLLFADGNREVVEVDTEKSDIYSNGASIQTPMLVTYEQSGSKYEINKVTTKNDAGYDNFIDGSQYKGWYVKDGKVLNTSGDTKAYINEAAVIFLKYGTDDYKIVTGDAMKNWGESTKFGGQFLTDTSNGYPYTKVAFINTEKNPTGSDKTYAYIFNVEEAAKDENNNNYVLYNVFDGSEMTTLKVKQAASSAYAEGTVVEYTLDSDGYADCTVYGKTELAAGFLTSFAWDGKGTDGNVKIGTSGTSTTDYAIDKDDTMVLYIDTDAQTGVAEASLQEAIATYEDGTSTINGYTNNVAFYSKDGKTLDILIVDVTNEIDSTLF